MNHTSWLKLLLTFSIFFSFLFASQAQNTVIKGDVKDAQTQDPLVGATLFISEVKMGDFSDESGSFRFDIPKTDLKRVTLRISFSGYETKNYSIPLDSLTELTYNFELLPQDYTYDDVVITATKGFEQKQSDATVSIEVIKQEAINLQATPEISKVLVQIPGVDNLDGQLNIRGSSGYAYGVGSRVMLALDGLPLLSADGGSAQLSMVPVDNIHQVEVLKGASSVLYGSGALGGVINVITAEPDEKPRTSIRLRGSVYGDPANKALDWDGDDRAYQYSTHIFHSRKIGNLDFTLQTDFIKDSGYRLGTDTEEFRGILMTKYHVPKFPGMTFGVNTSARVDSTGDMLYWRSYFPDTINGVVSGGALTPTEDAGGFRKQLAYQLAIDPYFKFLTQKGDMYWYRGRYLRNVNNNNTNQSSTNYTFYNDFLYQRTVFKNTSWITGITYQRDVANGDSIFGGRYIGETWSAYSQMDGKFGKLNARLGFRYTSVKIDTLNREEEPTLSLGLNYEIARGTNVRFSFGQAFRVPTVAERFTNTAGGAVNISPNPTIKSETGSSIELAIRQGYKVQTDNFFLAGYLDFSAFRMRFRDMVEFGLGPVGADFSFLFTSINVANARISGLELTTQNTAKIGKWNFNLSGGITFTDPEDLDAVPAERQLNLEDFQDNNSLILQLLDPNSEIRDQPSFLKYRNRWLARASFSAGYDRISFTTNFRYRSFIRNIDQLLFVVIPDLNEFREMQPNGEEVFDFILSYNFPKNHTLSLTLDNAFNEEYLVIPGLLAEQRKLTLQYQVRF